jgi:hypothetical protein
VLQEVRVVDLPAAERRRRCQVAAAILLALPVEESYQEWSADEAA